MASNAPEGAAVEMFFEGKLVAKGKLRKPPGTEDAVEKKDKCLHCGGPYAVSFPPRPAFEGLVKEYGVELLHTLECPNANPPR